MYQVTFVRISEDTKLSAKSIKNNKLTSGVSYPITPLRMMRSRTKEKGKHAHSTHYRRLVWENIVWPLIIQVNRPYFTLEEYQCKRNEFCKINDIPVSKLSGGLVSLIIKGILKKDYERRTWIYSIHYRLIPYMRKKTKLEYGLAVRESSGKR